MQVRREAYCPLCGYAKCLKEGEDVPVECPACSDGFPERDPKPYTCTCGHPIEPLIFADDSLENGRLP